MSDAEQTEQVEAKVIDALEVDDYVEPRPREHHDQYAHFTHETSEDSAEAASRALVRAVPLAYGVLLGVTSDELLLGLAAGIGLGVAFDLYMGANSITRALWRRLRAHACPVVAVAAHAFARGIGRSGLPAPAALSRMRCPDSSS